MGRHYKSVVISSCSPKFPAVIFSATSSLKVKRPFPDSSSSLKFFLGWTGGQTSGFVSDEKPTSTD
jgi:hypothetical protein